MEHTQITVERRGADDEIVLVTLNRPEKLNAWTPTMADEQAHAIEAANDDPNVGAIVMTGAGRGFCAGADMEATFKSRIDGVDPGRDTAGGMGGMPRGLDWVALLRASKPIVCAVNGAAVDAHRIGLVDELVDPEALVDTAIATASSYAANPDLQLRMTKQLLTDNAVETDLGAVQRREMEMLARCWTSAEHAEAVNAFLEKRAPSFRPAR